MKRLQYTILLAVFAVGLQATTGAPLQRADVVASPAWVFHLDCDRLRPTALGQFVLTEMEKPEAEAKIGGLQAITGLDIRRQLHGITLYGVGTAPKDAVAVIYADIDSERLTSLAKAAKDAKSSPYRNYTIHSWIDEKKSVKGPVRTYAAVYGSKVVVFGQQEEKVARALDALDHSAPGLAASTFPELGSASSGFLQASASKLDLPDSDPNAAMFRLSKSIAFSVTEQNGQVNAVLNLATDSDEVASHMYTVAQGLVALAKLQKSKPVSVKIADATSLKQDGAALTATVSMPSAEAVDTLKAASARKAQKAAETK